MPRPRIVTAHIRRIAALLHAEGETNKEIGSRLSLSESAISKMLRECYAEGLLSIRFRSEGLSPREIQILRAEAGLKNRLTERLRMAEKDSSAVVTEPDVMIIDSGSAQTSARAWTTRLDAFAKGASHEVMKLILRSGIVGVSWGRTLATVVRAMRELPPATAHTPIQFIPLCGEMLDGPPRKTSSSTLAYRLDEIVNTAAPHLNAHWLAGVPSHLPLHFPKEKAAIIAEYIHSLPAHRAIFGGGQKPKQIPLAERADMILTSCGPEDRPLGYDADRWFESTGISVRDARAFIAGDISGNLLRNSRAVGKPPAKVERKIAELNEAWLGARLHHLRGCARRALDEALPGVVLCAIGANKAGTVREIVRLGLANRILLDGDCWAQLEAML